MDNKIEAVEIVDWDNKKVGEVELPADVFDVAVRTDILHSIVLWQLSKRRSGTHSTKSRGEVSGTSKKPYKQKGTGGARRGDSRSPLVVGGAITFGPKPRDYEHKLNSKVKKMGLKMALTHVRKEGLLKVVESFEAATGKTKEAALILKNLGVDSAVVVHNREKFKRSLGNLPRVVSYSTEGVNVYDLLKHKNLIIEKSVLSDLLTRLSEPVAAG